MKLLDICLFSVLLLLSVTSINAQCPMHTLKFTTQESIDQFIIDYPNCTEFQGDLTIDETEDGNITDLSAFQNLQSISGILTIENNKALSDLSGFDNLTTVGVMVIFRNEALSSLQGINQLDSINESIFIHDNPVLASLAALENITEIPLDLSIKRNMGITDLFGCHNITSVGRYLNVESIDFLENFDGLNNLTSVGLGISFSYLPSIKNLEGLENLSFGGRSLSVLFCDGFETLQGLDSLTELEFLGVSQCPSFRSFEGIDQLTTIPEGLTIINCPSLSEITGLENITKVGRVRIDDNPNLTSLNGLENVVGTIISLRISGNPVLTDLTALSNVDEVMNDIAISSNNALTSLEGLHNIKTLGSSLSIINNVALSNLDPLSNLNEIANFLVIIGNENLNDISGLENIDGSQITTLRIYDNVKLSSCDVNPICSSLSFLLSQDILIYGNKSGCNSEFEIEEQCLLFLGECPPWDLVFKTQQSVNNFPSKFQFCSDLSRDLIINGPIVDLSPLEVLTSIGEDVKIKENISLTSLQGLQNITSIGGNMNIHHNPQLADLEGLNGIQNLAAKSKLTISRNDNLSNIEALENIDTVDSLSISIEDNSMLASCAVKPVCYAITKTPDLVFISDNAEGCNTIVEIEDECILTSSSEIEQSSFFAYPNPTTNTLFLSSKMATSFAIYNTIGDKNFEGFIEENSSIDVSRLNPGIYILKIGNQSVRFVKI